MLHDSADDCTNKTRLNFNLSSSLTRENLVTNHHSSSDLNLLTASNESLITLNNKCPDTKENLFISFSLNAVKSDLLPSSNSNEKLSWKFFEQVDSLDNQLRSDVSTPPAALLNGSGNFLKTDITDTTSSPGINDINLLETFSLNVLGMHSQYQLEQPMHTLEQTPTQLQIPSEGCNRKSNGFAINGTLQTTEILSETNASGKIAATTTPATTATANDLRFLTQPEQKLQQPTADFVFTSPTSTFKRKKQQQLLKEKQEVAQQKKQQLHQQEYCNNNLNKFGNSQERPIGTIESATTFKAKYSINNTETATATATANTNKKGSNLTSKQQRNNNNTPNNKETVISNSLGVTLPDTVTQVPSSLQTFSYICGNGTLNRNSNSNGSTRLTFKTNTLPAVSKTSTYSTFITDGVVGVVSKNATTTTTPPSVKTQETKKNNKHKNTLPSSVKHCDKMQASSSGGSGTTTTAKGNSTSSLMDDIELHLGLIGWRKKCLYTLLVLLMLLIIINLGLTLWILKVMEFSTDGMGQLKIVPGGIQLTGQALIMDMLRASTIRSRHGQPISIESSRNFSINTRDTNGMLENHLFLGHDKLECLATSFHINDTNGRNLFSVNRNEVTIGAHALRIEGEGGAIFRESIQTPHVRAEPTRELRLESPTRQLEMTAAKDINFQSRAGGIEISALKDVKLTALDGSIRFESSKIFMPNLRTVQLPLPGTQHVRERQHGVYQLCACANGKLFLAEPHSICAGDDNTVCR